MKRSIVLVTEPADTPVSLTEAKLHLRMDSGTTEDSLVTNLINSATKQAEAYTARAFITQTRRLTLDAFPDDGLIELPYAPIGTIGTLAYIDGTGGTSTVSGTGYQLDTDAEPARLVPSYGNVWPATRDQLAAVQITYDCGYGTNGTDVPEPIRQAVLIQVAHAYENRGEDGGDQLTEGVKRLLYPYRVELV